MNTDNVWFTADTHAWHGNIINYCDRPWSNEREMTRALADNINAVVPAHGILYHLGDFSWGDAMWVEGFRSMINCRSIHLVLGNHDKLIRKNKKNLKGLFSSVSEIDEVKFGRKGRIVLCHYAMRTWNASYHGSWHLYGHSHGTLQEYLTPSFDVGVDCWDYKPVSFAHMQDKMERKIANVKHEST